MAECSFGRAELKELVQMREGDLPSFAWLANRSSFIKERAHRRAFGAMVGNLRVNHERRLVAQICPRWNRLQPWFELVGAFKNAA